MATSNQDSEQRLCEEILAEARRESERIVQEARQQAAALLSKATDEAEKARCQRLDLARTEAARREELLLATVPLEASRLRSERIEALLQSVYEAVHQRMLARNGFDSRQTVIALAAEAVSQMAGDTFVVKLSAADRAALGNGLAGEIARYVQRGPEVSITIADEPALTEGSVMVGDSEGRQVWDNRLTARLERMWPELRRQIAVGAALLEPRAARQEVAHD